MVQRYVITQTQDMGGASGLRNDRRRWKRRQGGKEVGDRWKKYGPSRAGCWIPVEKGDEEAQAKCAFDRLLKEGIEPHPGPSTDPQQRNHTRTVDILDRVGCPYNHKSCVEAALAAGTSHTQWNGGRLALTTTIDSRAKAERRNCMAGPERCGKSQCRRTIKKLGIAILQHRTVQGQRWANAMVAGER